MPRQARVIVPGFPHHIVQRGHNRQPVFVERRDFEYYLANLQEWKQVYELEVFSYCLMTNHVHLVVQANDNVTAIPQLMKRLAGRQTRFVNSLENAVGRCGKDATRLARLILMPTCWLVVAMWSAGSHQMRVEASIKS